MWHSLNLTHLWSDNANRWREICYAVLWSISSGNWIIEMDTLEFNPMRMMRFCMVLLKLPFSIFSSIKRHLWESSWIIEVQMHCNSMMWMQSSCIQYSQSSCTFLESGLVCPNLVSYLRKRTHLLFPFEIIFRSRWFFLQNSGKYLLR